MQSCALSKATLDYDFTQILRKGALFLHMPSHQTTTILELGFFVRLDGLFR